LQWSYGLDHFKSTHNIGLYSYRVFAIAFWSRNIGNLVQGQHLGPYKFYENYIDSKPISSAWGVPWGCTTN